MNTCVHSQAPLQTARLTNQASSSMSPCLLVPLLFFSASPLFSKGLCPLIIWHPVELFQCISYFSFTSKWTFLVVFLSNRSLSFTHTHTPAPTHQRTHRHTQLPSPMWKCFIVASCHGLDQRKSSSSKVAALKLFIAIIYLKHLSHKSLLRLDSYSPLRGLATLSDCKANTFFGLQPVLSLY